MAAAEEVEVEVVDGHPGGIADVEGEAVALFPHAFHAGDILGEDEEAREHFGVVPFEIAGVIHVLFGDDQAMDRGARVDIADGEGVVVFGDTVDGDFAPVHAAEEAILHAAIVAGSVSNVDSAMVRYRKSYEVFTVGGWPR